MRQTASRLFVSLILLSFLLNLHSTASAFSAAESGGNKAEEVWQKFRKNDFPFHIQTLAYDQKTGTLIISEPPPHVTTEEFGKKFPELSPATIKEQKIGYDGWVKDLVFTLPAMEASKRQDLFDRINLYLFRTAYKSEVLSLPVKKSPLDKSALDLTVTSADLKDWLIDKNESLEAVLTGEQNGFNDIVARKKSGVYKSEKSELVVWAIDRKKPLDEVLPEARQFALDSDLIVGAISNPEMLAIVGRGRILPTDAFPPLRTETILQLAAVQNPELAQSYERNYVFAGRFNDTQDWAPIYLSDELIDTEYGNLLNITDQILKSWSMKGKIRYAGFESYEAPNGFPFEDKTLIQYLGINEVTFNWNTLGAGYSSEADGKHLFALNRTGALPVSYFGEEAASSDPETATQQRKYSSAEDKAYDFFAKVGDPNLTRVVQYASLYQIFQDSQVTVGKSTVAVPKYAADNHELYDELINKILGIKEMPQSLLDDLFRQKDSKKFAEAVTVIKRFNNAEDIKAAAKSILDPRSSNNQTNAKVKAYIVRTRALVKQLDQIKAAERDKAVLGIRLASEHDNFCAGRALTAGEYNRCIGLKNRIVSLGREVSAFEARYRTVEAQRRNLDAGFGGFRKFNNALGEAFKFLNNYDASFSAPETDRLRKIYLASLPPRNSRWIHTPSIVVSSNSGEGIGGHNLDSKITAFKTGAVAPGKVQIVNQNGRRIIITNPADAGKISLLVRTAAAKGGSVGAGALKTILEQKLSSQKTVLPRPKSQALRYVEPNPGVDKSGWFSEKRIAAPADDFITITKRADGAETIAYRNREITAFSPTSRNDFLANIKFGGRDPVRLRMLGYKTEDANALVKSISLKSEEVTGKTGSFKNVKEFFGGGAAKFAKDYDFARAKIFEPQFETSGSGAGAVTKVSIDVDVPLAAGGGSKLSFRIEKLFRGALTKLRANGVAQRVKALFNQKLVVEKHAADKDVMKIASEVEDEIRRAFPEILDVKVKLYEIEDLNVAENLRKEREEKYADAE